MICALLLPITLAAVCDDKARPGPERALASTPTRIGKWSRIGEIRLRPERVVEDSRCPMNARCVWAGRVVVQFTLREGNRTRVTDLILGYSTPVAGGNLHLSSVTPEKMAGTQPTRSAPYRFTLELRR